MSFNRLMMLGLFFTLFASPVHASSQCHISDHWTPIEQTIYWTDYVENSQLTSRVQLLNVWAIWCKPCRQELPILATLDSLAYIDVHLLNMGDEPAQAQAMLEELSVASLSASVSNNPSLLKDFNVVGIPLTVMFIDGKAAYRYLGILEDDEPIKQYGQCLTASGE